MDVFASPSDQETFGLAVLEALACGLPAIYAACPPLDEYAGGAVPGGRRLPRDGDPLAGLLRTELAAWELRGRSRLRVPAVVTHYDAAWLAASVSELYERVAARPRSPLMPATDSKGRRG
jgi:glycosyltransferase involved in cell wall biosynthesis